MANQVKKPLVETPAENSKPKSAEKNNGPKGEAKTKAKSAAPKPSSGKKLTFFALLLALLALAGSGYLWYFWQKSNQQLEQQLQSEIQDLKQGLRTLDDHPYLIELKQRVLEQDTKLSTEFAAQQNRIDALQQAFITTRDTVNRDQRGWVLAEVEYLMRIAITRLRLIRDIQGATEALITADKRLSDLADPAQLQIREVLASEITALKSLHSPDIDGAALKLIGISNRLYLLPQAKRPSKEQLAKQQKKSGPAPDDEYSSFAARTWSKFKEVIGFSQSNSSADFSSIRGELYFIDQLIRLELEAARQSVLRLDKKEFDRRIATARNLLDEHYDRNHEQLIRIRADLAALLEAKLFPELPDISGSLRALRKQQLKYQPDTIQQSE